MSKREEEKGKPKKVVKKPAKKADNRYNKRANCGYKNCLRCGKQFMSNDVCRNRICVPCTRLNCREWSPGVYRSGLSVDSEDHS